MEKTGPSPKRLKDRLAQAGEVWDRLWRVLDEKYGPLTREWRVSKSEFDRICLVKSKKRTIIYLTPEDGAILVAVVLGERAAADAFNGELPGIIKDLIREARPYAEGRGIRFPIRSIDDISIVDDVVGFKMAAKPRSGR